MLNGLDRHFLFPFIYLILCGLLPQSIMSSSFRLHSQFENSRTFHFRHEFRNCLLRFVCDEFLYRRVFNAFLVLVELPLKFRFDLPLFQCDFIEVWKKSAFSDVKQLPLIGYFLPFRKLSGTGGQSQVRQLSEM